MQYAAAYTSPPALADTERWTQVTHHDLLLDIVTLRDREPDAPSLAEMTEWAVAAMESDREAAEAALAKVDSGSTVYRATDDDGVYYAYA